VRVYLHKGAGKPKSLVAILSLNRFPTLLAKHPFEQGVGFV